MTETRAEPFTPTERAVMAARAEAAEWRARYEAAVHGRQEFRAAYAGVRAQLADALGTLELARRERDFAQAESAEARARYADLARQATAAGPVLEAAEEWEEAQRLYVGMFEASDDAGAVTRAEHRLNRAERALFDAVVALRAAREGK